MPTYLCHGFRWTRKLIRIFVILEDLEDAAPDWIVGRDSSAVILERIKTKFDYLPQRLPHQPAEEQSEAQSKHQQEQPPPEQTEKKILHQDDDLTVPPSRVPDCEDSVLVNRTSAVKLLEEYDPEETAISARPFAYVADHVIRIDLSANLLEETAKYDALVKERNEGNWFEKLRDELQADASIGWYVVVNGDEERGVPEYDDEDDIESDVTEQGKGADEGESEPQPEQQTTSSSQQPNKDQLPVPSRVTNQPHSLRHKISRAGLRRLFSKKEASG
ncbi:uncharacterized protein TrAFT101_001231 [Trichoderma asperellum]|uniref:Uncharacterized protein n=1 Tax=Trichoderma asperellum (strain ATCC 204424 / CBS 433.97 / NBRC 101777) TaxID=1042311 RepID=A0A2T3ZLX8_TRIA4|nr:hypothetical protein M441DRAFT_130356 [Trichoderma asperellum CBS 433.97]PTB45796.1 hypothetical protein M441DRAFT_130356 [Trichoderma asperellum CBS 433.97]UKZ85367.1 hypothetical protein TrAFT101_001231 [Trichoderma asperellum]